MIAYMRKHETELSLLQERIRHAVSEKIVVKVLGAEAAHHFKHGWKTDCDCSVCESRRHYVARMRVGGGYRTSYGGWYDFREDARAANKVLKKRVLS